MKYLNLIILLLFLLACQDKKKDEIKHLVSEWQGKEIRFPKDMVFTRFVNRYGRLHPAKIPHKVLVFEFHRMYQLQTPTAPMERTDSIHRLHYPRNGSIPVFSSSPMIRKKYGIY